MTDNNNIQNLLDKSAKLSNRGDNIGAKKLHEQIRQLRGNDPPCCFGDDDCSTMMLVQCPWRMDCGE